MIPILRKNVACLFANGAAYHRISCSPSLRLFSTSEEGKLVVSPEIFDLLLNKYHFSLEVATKVASFPNRVKDPANFDSVLSFLRESGLSNAQLEKVLRYRPGYLLGSLEDTIKPKVKVFQDFGLCSDDIAKIISSNPMILHLNFSTRVIPSLSMLKRLVGTNDAVAEVLRRSGWFLHTNMEERVVPNIEFLKSWGVPMERILKLLYTNPRIFLLKPVIMRKSVEKAEEMGANRGSNMFIYAVRAVASLSAEILELKLQAFRNWGFSEIDIVTMFGNAPQIISGSTEKVKRTIDCLLATGKYEMSCIVSHPASLGCSLEKRYKPRLQILEILEGKNLIKKWPTLGTLYSFPDAKFLEKFVDPYSHEIGEIWVAKTFPDAYRGKKKLQH